MNRHTQSLETYQSLEDSAVHDQIQQHNHFINMLNEFEKRMENGESFGQIELARAQYFYSKARVFAYLISGYYRGRQKYYESMAEIERADSYENVKLGGYNSKLTTVGDAENISRRAKGEALRKASAHEKRFRQWEGVALSYESAINAIKDMKKGGRAESDAQQFE